MQGHSLSQIVRDEGGHGLLTYVLVVGSFTFLVFQPSLIVASLDRLRHLAVLFVGQLGFAF